MNKEIRNMRQKKKILVMAAMMLFCNMSQAQIFIVEDDGSNERLGATSEQINLIIPHQGVDWDQYYTPLGEGILLLAAMGGAYLLNKKRKK